jgi:hypothetical protein
MASRQKLFELVVAAETIQIQTGYIYAELILRRESIAALRLFKFERICSKSPFTSLSPAANLLSSRVCLVAICCLK